MKNFYFGLATYHCLYSAYTDMVGKQKYLEMINRNWIDTTPWMWFDFWIALRGQITDIYLSNTADLVAFQFKVSEQKGRRKRLILIYIEEENLISTSISFQNNQYCKIDIPENVTWYLPKKLKQARARE